MGIVYSVQAQYPLYSSSSYLGYLFHSALATATLLIYFRLKLHPSVNLALPPVGWQST
jgi:hypothetical protein